MNYGKEELLDALVEEFEAANNDLEAATILSVADRLWLYGELKDRLTDDGWDVDSL